MADVPPGEEEPTLSAADLTDEARAGGRRASALLEPVDLAWMAGLVAAGIALRLCWASGFGLGDDRIFRFDIQRLLNEGIIHPDNSAYRFTWWLPTGLSCRIFGLSEVGLILPIVVFDALGIGLVYALGKELLGRAGAVVATLLLLVHPLDFAWSTMITGDIILSFFSGLTLLLAMRALGAAEAPRKRRLWTAAAVSFWLAFHAKVSAVLIGPPLLFLCWRRRAGLDATAGVFVAWTALLLAGSALVSYVFSGDPLAPYHVELSAQGLQSHEAVIAHRMTWATFWALPRTIFLTDNLGDFLFSFYPHVLVVLGIAGWFAGVRPSPEVLVWLVVVFLGMQLNVQRLEGVWVAGFRNVRHAHVFVYPIVLLLAGYLVALRGRLPGPALAVVAVLLAVGLWHGVSAASKTKLAFSDCRTASRLIASLPRRPVYSDFQLADWMRLVDPTSVFPPLVAAGPDRRAQLAVASGYLVTGGAREPLYGCIDCIPSARDVPTERWRLLLEVAGPSSPLPWRPEPLRVWETKEGTDAR